MHITATTKEAYGLFHEGILALAEIEQTGICVDVKYICDTIFRLERRIKNKESQILEYKEVKLWKQKYGQNFKLGSDKQLADILFVEMGLTSKKITEGGNYSVDASALESIDVPFVKEIIDCERLKKMKNTYLQNILDEQVKGVLHPFFNLHIPVTYRGSSDSPNFQNMPVRHKENNKLIRSAFLPRPGHRIGGVDYSGIEVKMAYVYHQDPVMFEYLNDPSKDMHRDEAMECYILPQSEVTTQIRYCAKNKFVFPQFYGDYWKSCAESLWEAIDVMKLITKSGTPLKEHLKDKGIKGLGVIDDFGKPSVNSFYAHIRDVENIFWNERFKIYAKWKKEWIKMYEKLGYVDMYTGFRCSGLLGKNEVVNYPVQGVAFHCLLWSLIQAHKWLKKEKLRSKIIGQIHDEMTMDNHDEEFMYVLMNIERIMCVDIREHWKWITIPLQIEAEFAPVNENWFLKDKVKIDKLTHATTF